MMLICLGVFTTANAHINPDLEGRKQTNTATYRMDCAQATSQVDQNINNVRARLLAGGDVWWDGSDGLYIVPNVEAGADEVSSIFAGAVWLGGVDPAGNLKVAAQTYGTSGGNSDFWPGPLDPNNGSVDAETCADWDKHFKVLGRNIELHIKNFTTLEAETDSTEIVELDIADIPLDVLGWPAKGNKEFFRIHEFELPNTTQGLAAFFDFNANGTYEPEFGDYPIIEIRGCNEPQYPDEMFFWIYNDAGGVHTQTQGDPIQMEIQVQSFAYATNDQLNNMTFQRYKLINRAVESIDSMYFAMWTDPDLGCYEDDYIGCDTSRSMMYVYNEDAADGNPGCTCPGGVNTYCTEVPILGVDYFRGPLGPKVFCNGVDASGGLCTPALGVFPDTLEELGMSAFVYYNNPNVGQPLPGTTDPGNAAEYYNYLTGSWRDGTPITEGGTGYGGTFPTAYVFPDTPDDANGWTMCSSGLAFGDRRTIQASGPMRLDPGAVNELIIGVPWVSDMDYPCPDISRLQFADDIAQALFDNCFDITDGPDAPDVCFVELDRQLVGVLSNDEGSSNNAFELYAEDDLRAPPSLPDDEKQYVFEGYKIYQLVGPDVSVGDLDDPNKAQIIYQADIKNGVKDVYNWVASPNPDPNAGLGGSPLQIWTPTLETEISENDGVRHTFTITEDRFANDDSRLVNHKKYYFMAIAYAYNNYEQFNPVTEIGQQQPYLEGRRNIQTYTAVPRPITSKALNSVYGDGAQITRLDGVGAGENFLVMTEKTQESILDGSFDGEVEYEPGFGPIDVSVFDPLRVQDGEYILKFKDGNNGDNKLDADSGWELTTPSGDLVTSSDRDISRLNEQLINNLGFSISVTQSDEPGDKADESNGAIGQSIRYENPNDFWLTWYNDGNPFSFDVQSTPINFTPTGTGELFNDDDPDGALANLGAQAFVPYTLCEYRAAAQPISPAWINGNSSIVHQRNPLDELNNVDIVFTSNRENWSKCIVVETANALYYDGSNGGLGVATEGNVENLKLRAGESVNRDGNVIGDGSTGMGWFPGYAIDVETGKRLNIFFGENSTYDGSILPEAYDNMNPTGRDMLWNPTAQTYLPTGGNSVYNVLLGAQHFIYVTDSEYDQCADLKEKLQSTSPITLLSAYEQIKWASMPHLRTGFSLNSIADGLIPNDVTIRMRVDNKYDVAEGTNINNGHPAYRFKLEGKTAVDASTDAEIDAAMDMINVVPNPYYGYSSYETNQFTNTVKITNLPAKCTVTIYTLDGKFIRQYKRDEVELSREGNNPGVPTNQINPDIEWDLENNKGIPVASGVYLIHIDAGEMGERVIKWFGVSRQFDPSGL